MLPTVSRLAQRRRAQVLVLQGFAQVAVKGRVHLLAQHTSASTVNHAKG